MLHLGSNMIKEKTVKELLDDLQKMVYILRSRLPKEAPLFFSKSIDPLRGLHLREACIHRIVEPKFPKIIHRLVPQSQMQ